MTSKQTATKAKRQSGTRAAKAALPLSRDAAVPRRHAAPRRRAVAAPVAVTPEERYRLIAEAAYHRAQRRDFAPGSELQDWLEAEAEVDARLRES